MDTKKQSTSGTRGTQGRYSIQIARKRRPALTISDETDRSTAIEKARAIGTDSQVLDHQTGRIYRIRLERWIKPTTNAAINGRLIGPIPARLLNDLGFAQEPFSPEGC
jgi:hypothetical protein